MVGALCRRFVVAIVVLAIEATISSFGHAAEFTIVNGSNAWLQHLYVSPCGARSWGRDQFAEALPPSRYFTVSDIAPGCYDIEFIVGAWNNCVLTGAALKGRAVWKVTPWTVFGSQGGDCSHVVGYVPAGRKAWSW